MKAILILVAYVSLAAGQFIIQPVPLVYQRSQVPQEVSLAHRAVVENALRESQLPPEYLNKFYKNPKIAEALAKESWFTDKEMPVFDRVAEKIPRERIFKIFKGAGWIRRR
ncbi:uncharacterized protein LOC119650151 [Hermetia illucens]|uniref:uncharacterized protein LOC119650151 n=1 Tax=Hermetia illucens TaxID=343691 RepID=UPI0018CC48DC|nr:uncharacterized protein LOC119650151 [Hermetia illucens]XP_037908618.1 uncharacterized protein LOC119650151 [Hermetia illucens]XP_037908620.1 uncharacterized protein LOC119650151 [Hermetia illucens]